MSSSKIKKSEHQGDQSPWCGLKLPKHAKAYWFVNVEVSDESDTKKYEVSMADTDFIAKLKFYFGFGYREKASATFGKSFKN